MVDYLGSSDAPGTYGAENSNSAAQPSSTAADVYEYKIEMPNQ